MAPATLSVLPDPQQEPYDWNAWLNHNGPRLLLFARQQTRSQQDAEDVLQDALVRLVDKLNSGEFVGDESAWLPYLYTSIRRLAIDLSRKDDRRHRREDLVSGDVIQAGKEDFHPWFEGDASDEEDRALLEKALKNLPEKFREVLVMKIWGERTFAEIGEALEISQNTAASRYRYGLEALKRALLGARNRGDLSI
jgi:RNA polymerase sigma-70 factor (ECF subfamily)